MLKDSGHGLPDVVLSLTDQGFIAGPDVCNEAARYLQQRGVDRPDRLSLDVSSINGLNSKCQSLIDECRSIWRARWCERHVPYTTGDLELALKALDFGKSSMGIPRSALQDLSVGSAALQLACQNRARFFMRVPCLLKMGRVFHIHKRGKPRLQLSSYRTIVLSSPDLSLAEALWAAQCVEDLWAVAGEEQFGKRDAMMVCAMDVDASRIREFLGLPNGTLFTDERDAFTTTWPQDVVCKLHDLVGLGGEDLVLGWSFLQDATVSVSGKHARSLDVHLELGMPEGRLLSPAFFVVGAASLRASVADTPCVLGLDPPEEAIQAYLSSKDSSDSCFPDLILCRHLAGSVLDGSISWLQAMQSVQSDADRLLLLDLFLCFCVSVFLCVCVPVCLCV